MFNKISKPASFRSRDLNGNTKRRTPAKPGQRAQRGTGTTILHSQNPTTLNQMPLHPEFGHS